MRFFIGVLLFSFVLLLSYFLFTTFTNMHLTLIVILSILIGLGVEFLFHRVMNKKG